MPVKICRWCGIKVRIWRQYCDTCRTYATREGGIYQLSGGPPFQYMSRLPKAGDP